MENFIEEDKEFIANTYGRFNVVIKEGHGSTFVDVNGKEYIDFGSGIGTNSFGVSDEEWVKAVVEQAKTVQHTSNLYYSLPQIKLPRSPFSSASARCRSPCGRRRCAPRR